MSESKNNITEWLVAIVGDRLVLSIHEAARILGVSGDTIRRLLTSGELESFLTPTSRRMVLVPSILEYLRRNMDAELTPATFRQSANLIQYRRRKRVALAEDQ